MSYIAKVNTVRNYGMVKVENEGTVTNLHNSGYAEVSKSGTVDTLSHTEEATGLTISDDCTVNTLALATDLTLENIKGTQMLLNTRKDGFSVTINGRVLLKTDKPVRYDSLTLRK